MLSGFVSAGVGIVFEILHATPEYYITYDVIYYYILFRAFRSTKVWRGGNRKKRGAYDKVSLPPLDRVEGVDPLIIYDVPGDGFCGFHSVLALFREIKYLENIAYVSRENKLDNFEKMIFTPLVRDFMNLKCCQKVLFETPSKMVDGVLKDDYS